VASHGLHHAESVAASSAGPKAGPQHGLHGAAPARQGVPTSARTTARALDATPAQEDAADPAARARVALGQASLLSALVAGTPVPEGFDSRRLRVQSRALAAKRADVVAKVAPELPEILGDGYRAAFLSYAKGRPMRAGYRRDALDFAEQLLIAGRPADADARRRLTRWWEERAAQHPPRRATRFVRAARAVLVRGGAA
jgi:hypothetical protein